MVLRGCDTKEGPLTTAPPSRSEHTGPHPGDKSGKSRLRHTRLPRVATAASPPTSSRQPTSPQPANRKAPVTAAQAPPLALPAAPSPRIGLPPRSPRWPPQGGRTTSLRGPEKKGPPMDAGIRRQEILDRLAATRRPLAATRLGAQLGVSRQVIVGDVALLRAEGHPIRATNRGYVLARPATRPHRSIFVQHTREDIAIELSAIIKVGGSVLDVSVEHRLYGQITVDLLIRSPEDLAHFLARLPRSTALSELTNGWHTHTIEADDEAALDAVEARMGELGFLR